MVRTFLFAAALFAAGPAFAAPAAHFLKDAIQGDYSEATLGRVIQARGASPQVRSFGAMLTSDHTRALGQAQAVAAREHVHIRASMAPEARDELYRLRRLSGARFDREVRRYMIDDHRKDVAEFKEQARTGDRATTALANATLPVLRKHLATAESIRR
jgi:putative membrane protein